MELKQSQLMSEFRRELDRLYDNRLRSPVLRVTKSDLLQSGVIVYGGSAIGSVLASGLISQGVDPDWIVDRDSDLIGKTISGIEVRPPSSLGEAGERFVLLGSTNIKTMANICSDYGVKKWITIAALRDWYSPISHVYAGTRMDGRRHDEELLDSYLLMSDEKSRDIFMANVRYQYVFDNDFSSLYDPVQFFPEDLEQKIDYSFFVDCGAYTGDTLSDWIEMFAPQNKDCRYFAFEPFADSFNALKKKINTLPNSLQCKITAINAAIGDSEGFVEMAGSDVGAASVRLSETGVPLKRIDDILADHSPTIIKSDIEGAELSMLRGAEQTIRRCRPTLAISAYHSFSDLWTIPQWIHKLNLEYKVYLRHHSPRFSETVCYAIPN